MPALPAAKAVMPLHLLKLCVGADSIGDLNAWIAARLDERRRAGQPLEHSHITRMVPKRAADLVAGGSLFWVIKGQVAARQPLVDVRPFTDIDGIGRCHLVLDPTVVAVRSRPCRAFQGWRYLAPDDAPPDLGSELPDIVGLPEAMRRELSSLGLL